jgi:hypothetical protein
MHSRTEIIADSRGPANAALRTRADFQVQKIAEEIPRTHAGVLAECNTAEILAAFHRAAAPAWAAEEFHAAVAAGMDADVNRPADEFGGRAK